MIEIKQIIKSRIQDIKELQILISKTSLHPSIKYQTIYSNKKLERTRTIKETELLCTLNYLTLNSAKLIEQFYQYSVQIIAVYDEKYSQHYEKQSSQMKENIQILYSTFFRENGFQKKITQLKLIMKCDLSMISPAIFLSWLGQWSKNIYSRMLQTELKKQLQKKKDAQISNFQQVRRIKIEKVRLFQLEIEKSQNSVQLQKNSKEIKKNSQIFIHNRENVYGYMLEDLMSVYKFYGFVDLDYTSLKLIKKMGKKSEFLEQNNIQIASQMLISTSNQQIKNTINQYSQNYYKRYPTIKKKPKSTSCSPKKLKRQITQIPKEKNLQKQQSSSKFFSPKISHFEFSQDKIQNEVKRIKLINVSKTKKFNLEFPIISKTKNNNEMCTYSNGQSNKKSKVIKFNTAKQFQKINASEITIIKPSSKTTNMYIEAQNTSILINQVLPEDHFKNELKNIFQEKLKQENKNKLKKFNPEYLRLKPKVPNMFVTNE